MCLDVKSQCIENIKPTASVPHRAFKANRIFLYLLDHGLLNITKAMIIRKPDAAAAACPPSKVRSGDEAAVQLASSRFSERLHLKKVERDWH